MADCCYRGCGRITSSSSKKQSWRPQLFVFAESRRLVLDTLSMKPSLQLSRRSFLKSAAATSIAAPFFIPRLFSAPPSERVLHASFGAGGMARADLSEITSHKNALLVAVADVEPAKANDLKKKWPDLRIYADWRDPVGQGKREHSVNVSTPDRMHAPIAMGAMQRGLHVYGQKPFDARSLRDAASRSSRARRSRSRKWASRFIPRWNTGWRCNSIQAGASAKCAKFTAEQQEVG